MKIAFCTIASANYLSRVQVLEKSLHAHYPDADLRILLCERPECCREIVAKIGRPVYSPADVSCVDWLQMAFYYDITEYNTALKPFFLETLLKEGYEAIVYFDPDIEVYGDLTFLTRLVTENDVVLTPHVCKPVPTDAKSPVMASYIRAGQFNLGFLGIANSGEVIELLHWWQSVLVEKCIFDVSHQYFVDQFWAAAFPSFSDRVCILRDPAYNMAYWNVFQRKLNCLDEQWVTDSGELKFFRFSGLSRNDLTKVSVHQDRVTAPVGSPLYRLLAGYFDKLQNQEWAEFSDYQYSFAKYANGEPITNEERKAFLGMSREERNALGDPFEANNMPQNIIRVRCHSEMTQNSSLLASRLEVLNKNVEMLEKNNALILNSLSWKVTAPLRKIHALLTGN